MLHSFEDIGADWLEEQIQSLTDAMEHMTPVEYNEKHRWLPSSVTSRAGYIRYSVNPYMREILNCFDVDSLVREVALMKGVQITWTTLLESVILYYADYVGTLPMMYVTADKDLANARVENNIIPMINQSDLGHIIKSSDEDNSRKTGKTKDHIQFVKGGYLVPFGANNPAKMRSYSIAALLRDEIDGWKETVGKDGDPDALTRARTDGYTLMAKIGTGSTPTVLGKSKIHKNYLRGDQRKYRVRCRSCGFPQELHWKHVDKDTGVKSAFLWDLEEGTGNLIIESVRYACINCQHEHFEKDKRLLFSEEEGAHWHPTAKPVNPYVRSYHLPGLYSPAGMKPWWGCVEDFLKAYDPENNRTLDIGKLQVFYNNVLAEPFETRGQKIRFESVSAHRRTEYSYGSVPNELAKQYMSSRVLFLVCTVDVHDDNLSIQVTGWTRGQRMVVIDYWRDYKKDGEPKCSELSCPVWYRLQDTIENKIYEADDGYKYGINLTLIDAGYSQDTVTTFCSDYDTGVIPILGRGRMGKRAQTNEFTPYTTKLGTTGFLINVDYYKDRMASAFRREWQPESGEQPKFHFNTAVNATKAQLEELSAETRVKKTDDKGTVWYEWHRPSGVANEHFDLTGYAHAGAEMLVWSIWIDQLGHKTVNWEDFWAYALDDANADMFARVVPSKVA